MKDSASPSGFQKIASWLLYGSSALYALVLFVPIASTRSPWDANPLDRLALSLGMLLPVLAGRAIRTFPWMKRGLPLQRAFYGLLLLAGALWLIAFVLLSLLLMITADPWR